MAYSPTDSVTHWCTFGRYAAPNGHRRALLVKRTQHSAVQPVKSTLSRQLTNALPQMCCASSHRRSSVTWLGGAQPQRVALVAGGWVEVVGVQQQRGGDGHRDVDDGLRGGHRTRRRAGGCVARR